MIIEVIDGYELRSSDGMNWQVFEYRKVERREKGNKRTGQIDYEWVGLPSYHGSIAAGIEWISDYIPKSSKNRGRRATLAQFLEDYGKIKTGITKSANKMAKAVKDGSREESGDTRGTEQALREDVQKRHSNASGKARRGRGRARHVEKAK